MKLTNKESRDRLHSLILSYKIRIDNYVFDEDIEALNMGIEALENQEAMQVELEGDGYSDGELVYDYGKCPKCGWDFEDGDKDWEEPYCCHCGQRLHWFDKQMEGE